jgi:hypothetical protein
LTAIVTVEAKDEILMVSSNGFTKEFNEDGTLKSSHSNSSLVRLEPGQKGTYSVYKGASLSVRVASKYDLKPRKEASNSDDEVGIEEALDF